jgi:pyruvate ferredoxin oxidoreductase gamma subunit
MTEVFQTRIHGRGGQGVVTAAELLSVAGFLDGLEAQAFPSFGSERMGAPVVAFCRLSAAAIRSREPISEPDAVIVIDTTLLHHVDVLGGLSPTGFVVINSARTPTELAITELGFDVGSGHVVTVPATDLARTHTGKAVPNVAMLGAFAALTGRVTLQSLEDAVRMRFGGDVGAANVAALRAAYDMVRPRSSA